MDFITTTDPALVQKARTGKRIARAIAGGGSRFKHGITLTLSGVDCVVDKDNPSNDPCVVLKTMLNGQPFDSIHITTLVRPKLDGAGNELVPAGSFNQLAIGVVNGNPNADDGTIADLIFSQVNGRQVRVKRDRGYTTMWSNGELHPAKLLEFDII